jgi:hypothetical protein
VISASPIHGSPLVTGGGSQPTTIYAGAMRDPARLRTT